MQARGEYLPAQYIHFSALLPHRPSFGGARVLAALGARARGAAALERRRRGARLAEKIKNFRVFADFSYVPNWQFLSFFAIV